MKPLDGVSIRDRLFPYEDSFSIQEYRTIVNRVRRVLIEVNELLIETVPPLNEEHDGDNFITDAGSFTGEPIGFQ